MSGPEAGIARRILTLENGAIRQLRATAKAVLDVARPSDPQGVVEAALAARMMATALDVRVRTRAAATLQFVASTGLDVTTSIADDATSAASAAGAYVKAWRAARAVGASGGGASGGGGSSDSWDDVRIATHPKIDRIATWEVVFAWNDQYRRCADALPDYRFSERWCAILDHHLCSRCRAMNGTRANPATGTFAQGWPPLHPDCRCFVVTTVD